MRRLSTFNFKGRDIVLFAGATILIAVFIAGIFELVFFKLGETLPYKKVIRQQSIAGTYYLPKYFNVDVRYKKEGIKHQAPDILAIGSSRIMSMSQEHMPYGRFYNAGVDASVSREVKGMLNILESIEDNELPQTVVIGIDPWLFNPNYPPNLESRKNRMIQFVRRNNFLKGMYSMYRFVTQRIAGYTLLVQDKSPWFKYLFGDSKNTGIGVSAKSSNAGFSFDGSFHYPDLDVVEEIKDTREWQKWLKQDKYRFVAAELIDQKALSKFKALLKYCREKNIKVIGLLLPFRNDFYQALSSSGMHATFFKKFRETIPYEMKSFGYECFDFSSPEKLGLADRDFVDVYHVRPSSFKNIVNRVFRGPSIDMAGRMIEMSFVGSIEN